MHRLRGFIVFTLSLAGAGAAVAAAGPSFDCSQVPSGSIEQVICTDAALGALDQRLAAVYAQAKPAPLADQRHWLQLRATCRQQKDVAACLTLRYTRRIAELQARYAMQPVINTAIYACGKAGAPPFTITFYETEPTTAIIRRGQESRLLYQAMSGSGIRYANDGYVFWQHREDAGISWGRGAAELRCRESDAR